MAATRHRLTSPMTDVLVVGGGAAGLTAAWRIAAGGKRVHVLERAPFVGGMAASTVVAGQRVDFGSHRLHPSIAPHLLHAVQSWLGDDLQLRPRNGRLRLRDHWLRFPLQASDLVRHSPPRLTVGALAAAARRPFRHARAESFADVVRNRFGRGILDEFYGPIAQKLWGTDPDRLSADVARRRIAATGAGSLLRRVVQPSNGASRTFWYPRHGYGQIVDAVAQAAVDAGATIELDASIRAVTPRADGVSVVLESGQRFECARLLWTAPLASLVDVVDGTPPQVRSGVAALSHRAMVLIYAVIDRPHYSLFDAHYIPDLRTPFSRLSEPKNYRTGPDPVDRSVLCAELPCWAEDSWWRATDDELARTLAESAELLDLPPIGASTVEVRRLHRVYPVYTAETVGVLDTVHQWVASLPNVVTFGRQALFVQDNLHHVMAMGWDAGELAAGSSWDERAWADANERFAAFVVDD
jgi:protoporphyrinogen oxidase